MHGGCSPPGELELALELVTAPAATPYGTTSILVTPIVHKSAFDACATQSRWHMACRCQVTQRTLSSRTHARIPCCSAHTHTMQNSVRDGHGTVTARAIEAAECSAGTAERSEGVHATTNGAAYDVSYEHLAKRACRCVSALTGTALRHASQG